MQKFLIIFVAIFNFGYASHNCLYRDDTSNVQVETHQTMFGTYIAQVNITNTKDSCFVNLNFDMQQGACVAYGVNFCNYEMGGEGYKLTGAISYVDSVYPSGIELTGSIHQNGCTIKAFKSIELDSYSQC